MRRVEQRLGGQPLTRREFIKLGLLAGAGYFLSEILYFPISVEHAKHVAFKRIPLLVPGLSPQWDNTTIVHISDLHVASEGVSQYCPQTCSELVTGINKTLSHIGADPGRTFVFDTGDFVSKRASDGNESNIASVQQCAAIFAGVVGTKFFVPGNHDMLYAQRDELYRHLLDAGYIVMGMPKDDNFVITDSGLPFNIVVTPDFTTEIYQWYGGNKKAMVYEQLEQRDTAKPTVWATHNASIYDEIETNHPDLLKNTLTLSGHTHGRNFGAVSPLQWIAGEVAIDRLEYSSRFVSGLYEVGKTGLVHVSAGLGSSYKGVRTAQSEVVFFQLQAA